MQTIEAEQRLRVAVGLLVNQDQEFFIQQRRPGTPCAGKWEFPGGKIEEGEDSRAALYRELYEELGIEVTNAVKLTTVLHDYEHAKVELDVFMIDSYRFVAKGKEGQKIMWRDTQSIREMNVLEAVHVILDHPAAGWLNQQQNKDE